MNVAGYIRVSLDGPVENVLDPETQRRSIEMWCDARGQRLVRVFADEGPTASSGLETRLGLADAFAAIRGKEIEAVVVAKLDRLAPGLILQEELLAELAGMGARLFSASENEQGEIDAPDEKRRLVREVVRDIPVYRNAMRDLWVRQRARRLPRADDGEEAALARIEHFAEQGLSVRDISRALSREGFRPRLSHVFDIAGLTRILRRIRPE